MRKLLFIGMLSLFVGGLTTPAFAKCDGGELIEGTIADASGSKREYCRSKTGMTWWAVCVVQIPKP